MYTQKLYLPSSLVEESAYNSTKKKVELSIEKIQRQVLNQEHLLFSLTDVQLDISNKYAEIIRNNFEEVVVLGIGGSSLTGQTICNLNYYRSDKIKLTFVDNVDPFSFHYILSKLNFAKTAFLVISKSGKTLETLAQTEVVINFFKSKDLQKHFYFITDESSSPLRSIAESIKAQIIPHPKVGGRFSNFTSVALLPAAIIGLDISKIIDGARNFILEYLIENPKSMLEALTSLVYFASRGFDIIVSMPYIDRLNSYNKWFKQIFAESLGKNGKGFTPLDAIGATDQHSLLQLFLDGPRNKQINVLTLAPQEKQDNLYFSLEPNNLHKFSNLIKAEQQATIDSLIAKELPVRIIEFKQLDEYIMGSFIMNSILEIIILADLLEINAYDQPAVEYGKILTKKYLQAIA